MRIVAGAAGQMQRADAAGRHGGGELVAAASGEQGVAGASWVRVIASVDAVPRGDRGEIAPMRAAAPRARRRRRARRSMENSTWAGMMFTAPGRAAICPTVPTSPGVARATALGPP